MIAKATLPLAPPPARTQRTAPHAAIATPHAAIATPHAAVATPHAALDALHAEITACALCPRLVAWRERVAREKRRAYRDETYWGRPVTGFGDPEAALVIVGLAPGAHGANRTGRVFTGDRSGDFLYAALHRAGLASQPTSDHRGDGLTLRGAFITLAGRCAPPDNHPDRAELAACAPFLSREIALLPNARAFLALGKIAYDAVAALAAEKLPPFAHGAEHALTLRSEEREGARLLRTARRAPSSYGARNVGDCVPPVGPARNVGASVPPAGAARKQLLASYHVSQQNTQTGRLTPLMFDAVLARAALAAGLC